jgi:hypothetical protein
LRKRMAVACSKAGVKAAACFEDRVEAAVCSEAKDEAMACSRPGIKDDRRRHDVV